MSSDNKAFMLGITRISPENRSIWAVMMTLEGMVLFDALNNGNLVINRAIPPFDSKFFAKGLMEDISLIFFQPEHTKIEIGLSEAGEIVCRYHSTEGVITDVAIGQKDTVTINRYDHNRSYRSVRLYSRDTQDNPSIFRRVELIALKPAKYKMDLDLLEAEPLNQ